MVNINEITIRVYWLLSHNFANLYLYSLNTSMLLLRCKVEQPKILMQWLTFAVES